MQEHQETSQSIKLLAHGDDNHFVINMADIHNATLLRCNLPVALTVPRPLYLDREALVPFPPSTRLSLSGNRVLEQSCSYKSSPKSVAPIPSHQNFVTAKCGNKSRAIKYRTIPCASSTHYQFCNTAIPATLRERRRPSKKNPPPKIVPAALREQN
jgi:hypothetical protein